MPAVFRNEPVPAPFLEKIRHTTWHSGCPVAPDNLRQLTVTYLDFDGHRRTGTLIEGAYEAARSFLDDLDVTGPGLYGSPSLDGG